VILRLSARPPLLSLFVLRTIWTDRFMAEKRKPKKSARICPLCKGSGLDKTLRQRYTTGGHNDRSCPRCIGECYIEEDVERETRS
jgi:DnaJ-class molecular chaperone